LNVEVGCLDPIGLDEEAVHSHHDGQDEEDNYRPANPFAPRRLERKRLGRSVM
jgi:hypothetical protein